MRIYRRNWLLAAAVALLALCDARCGASRAPTRPIVRLFPELYVDRAAAIELSAGSAHLRLARDAAGVWRLSDAFDYPAFAPTVENFLAGLASLTNLDLLTDRAAAHDEYGVGPTGLVARVRDEEGALLAALVQGAPIAGENGSYVRCEAENEVYRVRGLRPLALEENAWLDARLFSFASSAVTAVRAAGSELAAPLERTRLERAEQWERPDGTRAASEALRTGLRDLAERFFADRVLAASPADIDFGEPRVSLTLELASGERLGLLVGRDATEAEGGGVLVARDSGGFVLHLPRSAWEALRGVLVRFAES